MTVEHHPVRWEKVYVFISSTFGDRQVAADRHRRPDGSIRGNAERVLTLTTPGCIRLADDVSLA